jgi:hypothetical protein
MPRTSTRTNTYAEAMAASRDAGNKSMRAAGRTAWNDDDWSAAKAQFERLFGPAPVFGEAA